MVTVIELLSPWNKTPEAGLAEYLAKRTNVLYSTANLVELDLLRGGERLPTVDPLQPVSGPGPYTLQLLAAVRAIRARSSPSVFRVR